MSCTRTASAVGDLAPSVGAAMALTFTPKASFVLGRIVASGDGAAVLLSGLAGERPLFVDPLDCALLGPGAFHGPGFDGATLQAGVPVTITYTAGSTTSPLRLTFAGEAL